MNIVYSSSSGQTQELGKDLANKVKPGAVLCLYGNLGAGKTTFVKGLARGLGIKKRIISPTFTIIRSYVIDRHALRVSDDGFMFYHVDLYRLQGENGIESTGLIDIFKDKNAIIAIEWPEKLGSLMPKKRWDIFFKDVMEDKREIKIIKN